MKISDEKIAIIGAGALGSVYGSIFYDMDPASVFFIARGERYDRLKRDGVIVNGKHYSIAVVKPEDCTPVFLLIVAVKHCHLGSAINEMKKAVGQATTIISVMNGIDSEERVGAVFGMEKVVYGLNLGIDAVRENNSVTYANQGRIFFGEKKNTEITERVRHLGDLFNKAGIAHVIPQDMIRSLWFKYMVNVGANQASAVLGADYGTLRASSESMKLMESAMREVMSIARAVHVDLSEDDIQEWYKVLNTLNPQGKTSMLQDVEAGRNTEVDMFAGTLINLGKRHGILTPVNQKLFDELKRIEASVNATNGLIKH